ncbi:MAG TPA: YfhO family protein [Thermoanaerobaculia bacterium]|nr:YfhO family protein [Thermoanaerobaculia bacterium]
MHSAAAALAVFAAGCALLVTAFRWWRPGFPLAAALGHVALTAAFFAQPLFTGALQVPTDLAYEWLPFADGAAVGSAPRNFFQADTLLEQLPFHALVRQRLLAFEAPLWSHELGTGQPLLGNGQSAPFAPLHALALPLAPERGLTIAGAWQILLGLLAVHALLLWLGAGPWGAALGAVGAGLSTYAVVWIYDTPGMAASYVPGLLLGLLLVRAEEPRGWIGLVACALGLALSGHPETMAHAGLVAALVVVALLLARRPGRRRFLGRLATAAALSVALAAPALLPLLENIPQSVRGHALERGRENFQPPPFAARFLLPAWAPLALGSPPDGTYTSEWSFNEICTQYAGLLVLALAVAGALTLRGRPLLLVAGGAAALLTALRVPPFFELLLRLPVIGPGAHGRLREFWVLAIALAAGLTLERVAGARMPRAVAAAAIVLAGVGLALAPPPGGAPWPRAWWIVTLAGAAAALLALLVPRLRPGFPALVVAAVTLDLFLLGVRYHPAVPARLDLAPPPSLAYMVQHSRAATPVRVSFEDFDLPANLNALYGLWDPRGYDPMRPEDAARMVGWWLGRRRHFYQMVGDSLPAPDPAAHDYLAVRYLATSHQRDLPPPWRRVFEGRGGRVWENPQALPLFFLPRTVERAASLADAQRAAMGNDDFQEIAWATDGPPGVRPQTGQVHDLRALSNGFDLGVDTPTGGVVVSSVSYTSGWEVRVGDRGWPAVEVNGGFLGFRVPAGSRFVRLRYRPRGWIWGLVLCAAGAAAACLAAWGRRRGLRFG